MKRRKCKKSRNIQFYVNDKTQTVYAVTQLYGKTVKAKAKCSPDDTFDLEKGKELAAARLEYKVATLIEKDFLEELRFTQKLRDEMVARYTKSIAKLTQLCLDSSKDVSETYHELIDVEDSLK